MISLSIQKSTKDRLSKYGRVTSTWDSVLNKILDHIERCDLFWSEKS